MNRHEHRLPGFGSAILLALVAALLLLRLGSLPLVGPDEPRYARVAIEMHRSGDWVSPTLQGQPWLEKPALYYWLAALGYGLLGETETAARLPSVLAALLMVGATAAFGARVYGAAAGLHAGFVLGTSVLLFVYGGAASMDMLVAAPISAALGLLGLGLLEPERRFAVPAAYVFMALATLAKGPIGFLLPGLVIAGYLIATRDWRGISRVLSPIGLLLFLLVAGPWHVLVYLAQGREFVDVFLLNHNLQRFTSTIHHHPGPIVYYLPVLLVGLFPWSGLVIPAVAGVGPRRSRVDLFVLLWLLLPLAFFSVAASKLPGYVLPCLPPLALLMGRAADGLVRGEPSVTRWARAGGWTGLVLGIAVAAAPALLARRGEPDWVLLLPAAVWSFVLLLLVARNLRPNASGGLALLRVGASGLLVLLTLALPPILARRESGRGLFAPAEGREVLVWGAWRTNWMAGYFYNNAQVREVEGLAGIQRAAAEGPVLVLCGPGERRQIRRAPLLMARLLAEGSRENVLLEVSRSP